MAFSDHGGTGTLTALTESRAALDLLQRSRTDETLAGEDTDSVHETVSKLLQKEAAKCRDTGRIYIEGGETERVAAEVAEALIIEAYLPNVLTRDDVEAIFDEAMAALRADGHELSMRSIGPVMKPGTVIAVVLLGRPGGGRLASPEASRARVGCCRQAVVDRQDPERIPRPCPVGAQQLPGPVA